MWVVVDKDPEDTCRYVTEPTASLRRARTISHTIRSRTVIRTSLSVSQFDHQLMDSETGPLDTPCMHRCL